MRTGATAAGLALVGGLLGGCTTIASQQAPATESTETAPITESTAPAPPQSPLDVPSAADVVARLAPSVVTVRTATGVGSGVVYRPDVVLTNLHVVAGASTVTIDYADGVTSAGTVLAGDEITDVAVIRTARTRLPVPEYRTELPHPGDPVLAIGSPLGFEGTVTAGIVSALNRQIPGSAERSSALVDLIQVDAAISPGNSGGALLDAVGRVIGINEAYISPAAGAVSLGFAIPAATAVDIADQLLTDGTATHPMLGVSVGRLTPEIGSAFDVAARSGALVTGVSPGGPAAAADVQPGDAIVALGARKVGSIEDLLGALRETEPGEQATLTVVRGGAEFELPVTIGSRSG
jgi:serine protease Do